MRGGVGIRSYHVMKQVEKSVIIEESKSNFIMGNWSCPGPASALEGAAL